jgi:hypothetical protein
MNHYVSLSLISRKSSVHLYALYSPRSALRTFTPCRDQLVVCAQYKTRCNTLDSTNQCFKLQAYQF